jgi:hypothetical protein
MYDICDVFVNLHNILYRQRGSIYAADEFRISIKKAKCYKSPGINVMTAELI